MKVPLFTLPLLDICSLDLLSFPSLKDNSWTISSAEVLGSFLKISRSLAFIIIIIIITIIIIIIYYIYIALYIKLYVASQSWKSK